MFMSGYTVDAYKKDSVKKTLIFFYDAADSAFLREPFLAACRPSPARSLPAFDSTVVQCQTRRYREGREQRYLYRPEPETDRLSGICKRIPTAISPMKPGVDKIGFSTVYSTPPTCLISWHGTIRRAAI